MLGKDVDQYLAKQINIRQQELGKAKRDINNLTNYNNTTCWIKMASSVTIPKGKGTEMAQNYVLFNGTTVYGGNTSDTLSPTQRSGIKKDGAYETGDNAFGIVPMIGLLSLDIKAREQGMIKEANVRIKANSRLEFEIVNLLYLKLGYTILIEYGWSYYQGNDNIGYKPTSTLIDKYWFDPAFDGKDFTFWLPKINQKKKFHDGNYGAIFGRITNFSWDFQSDGSYIINLKIFTHGDIAESLRSVPSTGAYLGKSDVVLPDYAKYIFSKDYLISSGILKSGGASPDFKFKANYKNKDGDETPYILSTAVAVDKLSEHLFNLQLVGCGLNNWAIRGGEVDNNQTAFAINPSTINHTEIKHYWVDDLESSTGKLIPKLGSVFFKTALGMMKWDDDNFSFNSSARANAKLYKRLYKRAFGEDTEVVAGKFRRIGDAFEEKADGFYLNYTHETISEDDSTEKFQPSRQPVYVRLQYILWYLQAFCLPSAKDKPLMDIDCISPIPMYIPRECKCYMSYAPSKFIVRNKIVDYSYTKTSWVTPSNNIIFKGGNALANYISEGISYATGGGGSSELHKYLQDFLKPSDYEGPKTECIKDFGKMDIYNGLEPAIFELGSDPHIRYMNAQNIYCNITNVLSQIPIEPNDDNKTRINIMSLLKNLCLEINSAFGSINNLEPIIDEETNCIKLIDSTNMPKKKEIFKELQMVGEADEEYLLQLYGFRKFQDKNVSNFVRKLDLKTSIPKEMATMITIGSTAAGIAPGEDSTAFSKMNAGTQDRFHSEIIDDIYADEDSKPEKIPQEQVMHAISDLIPDIQPPPDPRPTKPVKGTGRLALLGTSAPNGWETFTNEDNWKITKGQRTFNLDEVLESGNMMKMHDWFTDHEGQLANQSSQGGSPSVGFLPFTMNLSLTGIEGFKIYDGLVIDSSFLPSQYPASLEFIITGIGHSFPNNDWVTNIQLSALPKQDDRELPLSYGAGQIGNHGSPPRDRSEEITDGDGENPAGTINIDDIADTVSPDYGPEPMWLTIAWSQEKLGVKETKWNGNYVNSDTAKSILNSGNTFKDKAGAHVKKPALKGPHIDQYTLTLNKSYSTMWCSIFTSWCLDKTSNKPGWEWVKSRMTAGSQSWGVTSTKGGTISVDTRRLNKWKGKRLKKPCYGCIVIFKAKSRSGGHIGMVVGASSNGREIYVLGGNQGQKVTVSTYKVKSDYRNWNGLGKKGLAGGYWIIGWLIPKDYNPPAEAFNLKPTKSSNSNSTT